MPSRREAWDGSTSETICRVPRLARTVDVYRAQRINTTVPAIALSGGQIKGEKSWSAVRGVRRPKIANLSFDCVKTSKLLVFHTNDLYLRLKSASGIPGTVRGTSSRARLASCPCGLRTTPDSRRPTRASSEQTRSHLPRRCTAAAAGAVRAPRPRNPIRCRNWRRSTQDRVRSAGHQAQSLSCAATR